MTDSGLAQPDRARDVETGRSRRLQILRWVVGVAAGILALLLIHVVLVVLVNSPRASARDLSLERLPVDFRGDCTVVQMEGGAFYRSSLDFTIECGPSDIEYTATLDRGLVDWRLGTLFPVGRPDPVRK